MTLELAVAQSGGGSSLLTAAALLVAVVVLAAGAVYAVHLLRKRTRGWLDGDEAAGPGPGFTLQTIREMKQRGELTQAEFDAAQGIIIAAAKAAKPSSGPRPQASAEAIIRAAERSAGGRRAIPGFDLTGAPLPPGAETDGDGRR